MLAAHNAVRSRAGVPPLAWSNRLAAHAQSWANYLLAHRQFFHRPNAAYGENLFEIEGAAASPAEVVDDWASESRSYNHRSNVCRGVCGHYTQIVWRKSTQLGCGVASCKNGGFTTDIWICNFAPAGNYVGQAPY